MSQLIENNPPTRSFWIVGGIALLWNLIGVASYWMTVTMSPQALAALPPADRAMYEHVPVWVTSAYAIAVFGGTLGSVAMLLRRAWAAPVFVVSLLAILVQMGHAFFMTAMLQLHGARGAVLPLLIIAAALFLAAYARAMRRRGWLR